MGPEKNPFSLYIHIPYCVKKCPYCDFNVHVVPEIPEKKYSAALLKEVDFYAQSEDWRRRSLKSVYFGGGTPSTFSPPKIEKIVDKAASSFSLEREIEISLEANPSREDSVNFSGYKSCGVNRISIGAQSFQPEILRFLGRFHTAEETRETLRTARRAGFENFNIDLIFGSPCQSLSDLKSDLTEALSFDPPHLSAYNLTIEEGTPFHREYQAGKLRPLDEETEIAMTELIEETLSKAGLGRYEISNYARPGYLSRHNLNYWQGGDYLGIGAGAHSYLRKQENGVFGCRWQNEKNPGRYMEKMNQEGRAVVGEERSDMRTVAGELMFLGLRMVQGIGVGDFFSRFGKASEEFYPEIHDWIEEGLMDGSGGRIRLTRRGLLVANSIFVNFV